MAAESNEEKQPQEELERAKLRKSQWNGEWHGTRLAGEVLLVVIPNKPQEHP
jgi:hypothetical protein